MFTLVYNGQHVRFDGTGFLGDLNDWNEEEAVALASKEGINSLSAVQLDIIIRLMREYFMRYKVVPILNNVCRIARQPKEYVNEQFMEPCC